MINLLLELSGSSGFMTSSRYRFYIASSSTGEDYSLEVFSYSFEGDLASVDLLLGLMFLSLLFIPYKLGDFLLELRLFFNWSKSV